MSNSTRTYNADLLKGTGLVQETLLFLEEWRPDIDADALRQQVLAQNVLGKDHARRNQQVLRRIYRRLAVADNPWRTPAMQALKDSHLGLETFLQLMFVFTCQDNDILFDFTTQVYQTKADNANLSTRAARQFIEEAIKDGRIPKSWAESTIENVAIRLKACLEDFKLLDSKRNLTPFHLHDFTANYLLHEWHWQGFPDQELITQPVWQLFGLESYDVHQRMEKLSTRGHFIYQHAGELIRITWHYHNLSEFLHGTLGS